MDIHPESIIEGLLRRGESMNIIGSPEIGKSWLVRDLALSIAAGNPWLGLFPCRQGRVMLIDSHQQPETLSHRLHRLLEARRCSPDLIGDRMRIITLRGRNMDVYKLEAYMRDLIAYDVVIIDAFYDVLPPGTDENDDVAIMRIYELLHQITARICSSLILVHDTPIVAGPDTELILRPYRQPNSAILEITVESFPPVKPKFLRWKYPVWVIDGENSR